MSKRPQNMENALTKSFTPSPSEKPSESVELFRSIDEELDALTKAILELREKISPVLLCEPINDGNNRDDDDDTPASPFMGKLSVLKLRVYNIRQIIHSIHGSCDL